MALENMELVELVELFRSSLKGDEKMPDRMPTIALGNCNEPQTNEKAHVTPNTRADKHSGPVSVKTLVPTHEGQECRCVQSTNISADSGIDR